MRALILLTCLGVTALGLVPMAARAADWTRYANDRYGFSVEVPAAFKAGAPPENGDGLAFSSPDGRSTIRAFGHLLVDEKDLVDDERQTELFSRDEHLQVTYRQASARAFTLSGLKGDRIVYMRAVATCKGIAAATIEIDYPQGDKARFDALIAHMAATLRGSNDCWAPG